MNTDLRPWTVSAGIVLAGFALIGEWLLWPVRNTVLPPPAQPMEAIAVEAALRPTAPPAPPSQRAIGPRQQASAASQSQPRPRTPPPRPRSPRADAVAAPPRPARTRVMDPVASTHSRPTAQATAPAAVAAAASDRYAAAANQAGATARQRADWQSLLLGRLKQYRRYPRQAERSHQQGVVWLRFAVDRQGRVADSQIQQVSGHRLLDQEALATLRRASPLPPPPPELPGDPVMVQLPVRFFLR
ncbi:energy transducer TonB [Frateuria aurantia]|uniref:TonB family protein n=1 Tax=Frateuria aurantia (strain ATCC 33424 / DSM 6220 / KCTC 2777 / LMG 1558 / NBRC 3245 / NCIMB 13370) TaxID=767434 RepID=H8L0F4_FRAAD|nr:energy transducer TonB [Frateuria aurantia]AFC87449.1 TonB family protein [Frateuria aurantia DSM 6220]